MEKFLYIPAGNLHGPRNVQGCIQLCLYQSPRSSTQDSESVVHTIKSKVNASKVSEGNGGGKPGRKGGGGVREAGEEGMGSG